MKKNIIITFVLVAVLAGGGYFAWSKMKPKPALKEIKEGRGPGLTILPPENDIIGWLSRGSAQCAITTDTGKAMQIMAKKQTVKIEGIPYIFGNDGQKTDATMIANPEWTYIWSGTQGVKINHKLLRDKMTAAQRAEYHDYYWEDAVASWTDSGYQYTCDETGLSEELFAVPTEVNFNDLTETLQALEQVAGQIPTATMNQEDIEAAMENLDQAATGSAAAVVPETGDAVAATETQTDGQTNSDNIDINQ